MTLEELVGNIRPLLPDPVDELQVAAMLESQGVTDEAAVAEYGMADVFELAHHVYPLLTPAAPAAEPPPEPARPWWADVMHGLLYLMPSAVYPAVFAVLGGPDMLRGLVFATTAGWVWGAGTSWIGHRLTGAGATRLAARTLVLLGGGGFVLAFAGALLILRWYGGGVELVLFVLAQTGFQVASGILLFHRREVLLLAAMLPACLAGVMHLISGYAEEMVPPVLVAGLLSVSLALVAGYRTGRVRGNDPGKVPPARVLALGALPSTVYAALCAAFLLHTDVRYVMGPVDLAVGVTPLVVGMGAVEWRVHRLFDQAGALLRRCASPALFDRAMWRLLLRELATCLLVLGALALVLLSALRAGGVLTVHGALLIDAHVLLGGAFFLGFVLIRTGGTGRATACLALVLPVDVVLVEVTAAGPARYGDVPVFLGCCAALSILLLTALRRSVGQVRHYR
ncbi:hypothetical protein ABZ816_17705 [Actinosynnema sp. NPDC047251]|uniref:Putative membrane protein n=1 Tax=Saccharothrix espanaensis (strain ATCC 51144 / DSM 44229 / JCM 9112 / NBRC 15066 / NRRL 15764) TaxID=1179773 RepID=K0K022_SACES|nr:hypothetical protein [Saccharothrix espanaensis]CCH30269.1 putative membrane protein [Saccharothrix espanaensis DSM 44229]